jgi:mono/diheme cytochrome c family protein
MPERDDQGPQSLDRRPEATDVHELHDAILRERVDPREGYEPVPMWFTALCGALVFWAGWYLAEYGGGGQPGVLDARPSARFPASGGPAGPVDPAVLGKKLYTAQCVSCHQQSGLGVPDQYPPLVESEWVLGEPARIKRILLHGLKGPVTVKGKTFNGNMPAFGERFDDAKLAAILTFIRSEWGNNAAPIPPESVAATRAATLGRRGEWTAPELEAIAQDEYVPPPPPKKSEPEENGEAGNK